jgi:menaquinone-dependent protoporphyrinogen oxidase
VIVLVAYASRHGATAGIAERIAAGLCAADLTAEARSVKEVPNVTPFDAFVIGSATYTFHWLGEATAFARRNRMVLAERPVWLFSSGPLGTDLVDDKGRDIFEATRPREFEQLGTLLHPRDHRVFFGAWDPDAPAIGLAERAMRLMPAARKAMPAGDFRDWDAIDAWAADIAAELAAAAHRANDRNPEDVAPVQASSRRIVSEVSMANPTAKPSRTSRSTRSTGSANPAPATNTS